MFDDVVVGYIGGHWLVLTQGYKISISLSASKLNSDKQVANIRCVLI